MNFKQFHMLLDLNSKAERLVRVSRGSMELSEVHERRIAKLIKELDEMGEIYGNAMGVKRSPIPSAELLLRLELEVKDFGLSSRARTALSDMGVNTLGDLIRKSKYEIKKTPQVGITTFNEIVDFVESRGYVFTGYYAGD